MLTTIRKLIPLQIVSTHRIQFFFKNNLFENYSDKILHIFSIILPDFWWKSLLNHISSYSFHLNSLFPNVRFNLQVLFTVIYIFIYTYILKWNSMYPWTEVRCSALIDHTAINLHGLIFLSRKFPSSSMSLLPDMYTFTFDVNFKKLHFKWRLFLKKAYQRNDSDAYLNHKKLHNLA